MIELERYPLRVVQVGKFYPPHRGGIETHLQSLVRGLRDHAQVSVIVSNDARETIRETANGVDVLRVGTFIQFASAPVSLGLASAISRANADIVHLHLPSPTAILAWIASGRRGPLVLSWHSDIVRQNILGAAFEPVMRFALRRASAVIVATQAHIDTSPILPSFRDKCHVVPYGIEPAAFEDPPREEIEKIRARFSKPLVLGVGRLVYYKGFDVLVRAMEGLDAHLVLIGEGPMRAALAEEIRRRGPRFPVTMLSGLEDISAWYRAASVFVLPSVARSEAFGIVQLEAMAAGTPVINTRLDSGVPLVSLDQVTGLTVTPGDVHALREAIRTLLDSSALRSQFGAAGRRRAQEHFRVETMVQRTLQIYRDVIRPA